MGGKEGEEGGREGGEGREGGRLWRWRSLEKARRSTPWTRIAPQRCKLEDLSAMIEKWESSVRNYEKRKGRERRATQTHWRSQDDRVRKYAGKNHLVLNKKMLNPFSARKKEIEGIIDARIGVNIKEGVIKSTAQGGRAGRSDRTDVDALMEGKDSGNGKEQSEKSVTIVAQVVVGYPRRCEPRWNLTWVKQVVSRPVRRVF